MKPPPFTPPPLVHTGLSPETWSRIRKVLADAPEVVQAVLYGSRSLGAHHAASDIDLTLKGPALSHTRLNEIDVQLDDLLLPWKMDLSCFDQLWPYFDR